eukprot:424591_1
MSTFPGFSKPIHKYKVVELKSFLRKRGLKVSGLKQQLINRLTEALEEEYESDNNTDDDTSDNDSYYSDNDMSDYSSQHNTTDSNSDSDIEILSDNHTNHKEHTSKITSQNNSNNTNNSHTNIQSLPTSQPQPQSQSTVSLISPPQMQYNNTSHNTQYGYNSYHHNSYVSPV